MQNYAEAVKDFTERHATCLTVVFVAGKPNSLLNAYCLSFVNLHI